MNEILVPNIVLSRDYTMITKIINGEISLDSLQGEHTIVLNPKENSNFLGLSHDFNFSHDSAGVKAPAISIEIIDPENKFNENFIFASLHHTVYGKPIETGTFDIDAQNFSELQNLKARAEQQGDFGYIKAIYTPNPNDNKQLLGYPENLPQIPKTVAPPSPSDLLPEMGTFGSLFGTTISSFVKNLPNLLSDEPQVTPNDNIKKYTQYELDVSALSAANTSLKSKVDAQIEAIRSRMSNPYVYILYGVGSNIDSWAGPFVCQMTNIEYKFTGSTGKKSIVLTFVPKGNITVFTGDNVINNGIGFLIGDAKIPLFTSEIIQDNTQQERTPEWSRQQKLFRESLDLAIPSIHDTVISLLDTYLRKATSNTDVLILLPDLDKICAKQLNYLKTIAKNYITSTRPESERTNAFIQAFAYTELFKSLGFQITKNGSFADKKFNSEPLPEKFIEKFTSFLGDSRYKSICASLIKMPDEEFMDPLRVLAREIANNGRPIDFEMEVIHDVDYIKDLSKFLKGIKDNRVVGNKPVLIVGDRALIEKFLFGKKLLEDYGVVKYKSLLPDEKEIPLDDLLTDRERLIFAGKTYQDIAKKHFLSTKVDAPYDFTSLPVDTFFFEDAEDSQMKLEEAGVSVFRLGTENANILDISTNLNMSYYMALQQIWFSEVYKGRTNSGSKDKLEDTNPNNTNSVRAKEMLKAVSVIDPTSLKQLVDKNKEKLSTQLGITNQDLDDLVSSLINMLVANKNDRNMSIPVDWISGDDAFAQLIRLLMTINRTANQATIKTLPAFHLSQSAMALPTALLILSEPGLVGKANDYSIVKTMSGFWRVIGFEHKITAYDISSSFRLVKDLGAGLPLINIQTDQTNRIL